MRQHKPSLYTSSILFDGLAARGLSFAAWVERLLDMGIQGVEIREQHIGLPGWSKGEIVRILNENPSLGRTIATNFRLDDAANAEKKAGLQALMDFAAQINAKVIRVFPGATRRPGLQRASEFLKDIIRKAEGSGLLLAVENTEQDSLAEFKSMLDALPTAAEGITFDTGNALLANEDPVQMYHERQGRVCYIHLKDIAVTEKGGEATYLGNGSVDFPKLYPSFAREQVPLCLEFPGGEDPWRTVELSLQYWLEL